jgi:protease I
MGKVLVLAAEDFEDSELRQPVDALRGAGHDVVIAGSDAGARLEGKKGKEAVTTDVSFDAVDSGEFEALLVPGGYSPDKLRLQPFAVRLVHEFDRDGKPIAAICHAGSLLIDAGVVRGRRMTSWPSIRVDLVNAGADWVDEPLVVDGNLITSRKPDDLEVFCASLLDAVGAIDRARQGADAPGS